MKRWIIGVAIANIAIIFGLYTTLGFVRPDPPACVCQQVEAASAVATPTPQPPEMTELVNVQLAMDTLMANRGWSEAPPYLDSTSVAILSQYLHSLPQLCKYSWGSTGLVHQQC